MRCAGRKYECDFGYIGMNDVESGSRMCVSYAEKEAMEEAMAPAKAGKDGAKKSRRML